MQRDDERPPSTGRPSLLSQQPPAGADRNSILNDMEKKPARAAAAPTAKPRNKAVLGAVVAGALALAVGGAVWMSGESEPEPALAHVAPAAPITPAPAVAPVAEPATATIVEETAAVSPAADNTRSLKDMLNDTPAVPKPPRDELAEALARPHAAAKPKPKLAQAAESKKADKPQAKPVKLAQKAEPAAKVKAKAAAAPDSDVALLAALMAHVQAGQPSKAPSTPAYQLKQCGLQNEAGAAQCRAHLCANAARKEPECKNPQSIKTVSES